MDPMGTNSIHFWLSILYHAWTPKKWFKPSPLLRPPQAVERKKKEKDSEMGQSELGVGRIPCP